MPVIDMLTRLNADSAMLRARVQDLTQQTTTGLKSQKLGDLGTDQPQALGLKADLTRLTSYGSAIDAVTSRNSLTTKVLQQLGDIASNFADKVWPTINASDANSITSAASQARLALGQVANLLNSQQSGQYVFGGTDLTNPPIPNASTIASSSFATQIATAVGSLGVGNAATVAATTLSVAQSDAAGTTPFSTFLSSAPGLAEPPRVVPTGDGQTVAYGILANRNALASSAGQTTGSWARDLLRGLASMAALTPASTASPADFTSLSNVIHDGIKSASNAIADESGALGQTNARLISLRGTQDETRITLEKQLSNLQDVDLAETITKLQGTQTALQASYSAISQLGNLSLVNFLK